MRLVPLVWSSVALAACAAQVPPTPLAAEAPAAAAAPGVAESASSRSVASAPGYAAGVRIFPSLQAAGRDAEIIGPIDARQGWTVFSGPKPSFASVTETLRGVAAQHGADGMVNPQCRRVSTFDGLFPTERVTCVAVAVRVGAAAKRTAGADGGERGGVGGLGSGFFINAAGDLVTNAHVVGDCDTVTVHGNGTDVSGKVVSIDPRNDLALVRTARRPTGYVELRVAPSVKLAEPVVAAGYPMPTVLSATLHVTDGSVSALAGVKGNSSHLQFSAPMQPGNSGGPLVDSAANLIGVNSSNLRQIAQDWLPQNVNFAIKTSALTLFLDAAGAEYRTTTSRGELRKTEIAARAERFTAQVICRPGKG